MIFWFSSALESSVHTLMGAGVLRRLLVLSLKRAIVRIMTSSPRKLAAMLMRIGARICPGHSDVTVIVVCEAATLFAAHSVLRDSRDSPCAYLSAV